ncbi:MAG TPA: DUF5522 domain-containing protein [Terriglobales bacterium]|nr:DUF5522 domain-containing protein [Terriglobales bacterium]
MSDELVLGEDYYIENECWVFTAKFLLKRGYCCRSGCRHCPYGFVSERPEAKSQSTS